MAQRLAAALQSRDEATACALVFEEAGSSTRLGWVRDPDSGGYPSHIAAWHGLGGFIAKLVEKEGVCLVQGCDCVGTESVKCAGALCGFQSDIVFALKLPIGWTWCVMQSLACFQVFRCWYSVAMWFTLQQ